MNEPAQNRKIKKVRKKQQNKSMDILVVLASKKAARSFNKWAKAAKKHAS